MNRRYDDGWPAVSAEDFRNLLLLIGLVIVFFAITAVAAPQ